MEQCAAGRRSARWWFLRRRRKRRRGAQRVLAEVHRHVDAISDLAGHPGWDSVDERSTGVWCGWPQGAAVPVTRPDVTECADERVLDCRRSGADRGRHDGAVRQRPGPDRDVPPADRPAVDRRRRRGTRRLAPTIRALHRAPAHDVINHRSRGGAAHHVAREATKWLSMPGRPSARCSGEHLPSPSRKRVAACADTPGELYFKLCE